MISFSEKEKGNLGPFFRARTRASYRENASRLRLNKPNYQPTHPLEKERHNGGGDEEGYVARYRAPFYLSISLFLCLCDRVWEGSLKILVRWSRVDETARNILPRARSAYAISIITLHEDGMLTRPCSSILGQSFINDGNV